MRSTAEFTGARVMAGKRGTRRIGKVLRAVFFPEGFRLAGFIVKRPDLLGMIKRPDRFLAFDRSELVDGRLQATDQKDSWDSQACRRLGLDWDSALILQGMALIGPDGERAGSIDSISFDSQSGNAQELLVSTGITSKALVGQFRVPVSDIARYQDLSLLMRPDAELPESEGGLAAKAGEQAAIVGNAIKTQAESLGTAAGSLAEKAGKGIEQAGFQAGKAIGKVRRSISPAGGEGSKAQSRQSGKPRGMFQAFKDEYKKASED